MTFTRAARKPAHNNGCAPMPKKKVVDASDLNNHRQEHKLRHSSLCNFLLSTTIFFLVVENIILIVLFSISAIKNEMQDIQ
jgi:hypothetical protein